MRRACQQSACSTVGSRRRWRSAAVRGLQALTLAVAGVRQVRTQTLVKNAIIQVDATPFKQFYQQHYGMEVGVKKKSASATAAAAAAESKEPAAEVRHTHKLLVYGVAYVPGLGVAAPAA